MKRTVLPAGHRSLAVVIPKQIASVLGITRGDEMVVTLEGKKIVFEKLEGAAAPTGATPGPVPTEEVET